MKLACDICVGNRLLPALAVTSKQRHIKSTLALCKHPKSENYCLILFNTQNKNGTKYEVKGNVSQILTRFISEGKATIQFKQPPHDLFLHADVIQLKSFLHMLKRILENKVAPNEILSTTISVTPLTTKNLVKKKLVIKARSEYPAKGFPRTLETLHINGIRRASLDRGILNLLKLKVLDLSDNNIEFLPQELSALNLSELNVSKNFLHKAAPKQWFWMSGNLARSLTTLNLASNQLKYLTEQIVKLHNLKILNVSDNSLSALPKGLGSLKNLRTLLGSNNCLQGLPGSIRSCQLQNLDISGNIEIGRNDALVQPSNFFSSPLSLKERGARRVLELKLVYSPEIIPYTLVNYLDNANYCFCGKACFEISLRTVMLAHTKTLAEGVTFGGSEHVVKLDCFICSLKCFQNYCRKRPNIMW